MKSLKLRMNRFSLLAALAVATLLTGFGSTSARANLWQLQDDFELNAPSTWRFEHSGVGGGYLDTSGAYSRSGQNDAYIYVSSGFSSVGRIVNFTPFLPGRTLNSVVGIYVRPWGGTVKINLEVIDPTTWTYIALKSFTLPTTYTYQLITTGAFIPYRKDVYVRVSILGGSSGVGIDVDDLTVQSQYY